MCANSMPINIAVKNGTIPLMEDTIQLTQKQINFIQRHATKKTENEWLHAPRGLKIELTKQQQADVLYVKDQVINVLSPSKSPSEILMQRKAFGFEKHAFKRILERIERLTDDEIEALGTTYEYAVYPETLEKVVASLMNSQNVTSFAEWKGYHYLNFNFIGNYDDREIEIVVNFEQGILIITVIIKKETGYFVREVYTVENEETIKKPSPY